MASENVPAAVAAIIGPNIDKLFSAVNADEERRKEVLAFADELARTITKAVLDETRKTARS